MNKKELRKILNDHKKWLKHSQEGKRANLCGADLWRADLRRANLCGADLCGADLRGADLRGANLCGADLCGADLRGADLRGANLCGANLWRANLCGADLRRANLCGANLCGADLRRAQTDKRYIVISCIGSRKDSTTYCFDDDILWCGCFTGTLDDFEKRVIETHKDKPEHLKEYVGAISYIKSLKDLTH